MTKPEEFIKEKKNELKIKSEQHKEKLESIRKMMGASNNEKEKERIQQNNNLKTKDNDKEITIVPIKNNKYTEKKDKNIEEIKHDKSSKKGKYLSLYKLYKNILITLRKLLFFLQ